MEGIGEKNIDWFIEQSRASHTLLQSAAEYLRKSASEVFFLTDGDGLRSLGHGAEEMPDVACRFVILMSNGAVLARIR
jgi:hypothetical protein